jgi:hypothetical protein
MARVTSFSPTAANFTDFSAILTSSGAAVGGA